VRLLPTIKKKEKKEGVTRKDQLQNKIKGKKLEEKKGDASSGKGKAKANGGEVSPISQEKKISIKPRRKGVLHLQLPED